MRFNALADICVDISFDDHHMEDGPTISKSEIKKLRNIDDDLIF